MYKQKPASRRDEMPQKTMEQKHNSDDTPDQNDIPVPPAEDVPAPIKEPFEEDKPNEPIIDEEKRAPKLIV